AEGLEGTSGSIQPRDHTEKEQQPAKPTPRSPLPSTSSVWGVAGEKPGAEVCPLGFLGIPAGRGALLRQEAIVSREDSGLPVDKESPAKALEKGSSQLSPGGSQGAEGFPGMSWSEEGSLDAAGKGRSRQGESHPGETRGDSSTTGGICPGEQSEGRAPGKGGSEGDPQHAREEPGTGKPPAQTQELPKPPPEQVGTREGRRAEVCPWETREQGRTVRAEICPWDTEEAQLEQERQEGKRKSMRPKSLEGVEQPGMGLPAKHQTVSKPSSQQAGITGSKKATICPWEVEDELLPKTEICPWEEAATPAGKEGLSRGTRGTSKGEGKLGSRELEDTKAKLAEMDSHQAQQRD
ncbi:GP179 protein, partial [Calyptomena viridis]|nr:GP179 protein [Calyptomena viridis]